MNTKNWLNCSTTHAFQKMGVRPNHPSQTILVLKPMVLGIPKKYPKIPKYGNPHGGFNHRFRSRDENDKTSPNIWNGRILKRTKAMNKPKLWHMTYSGWWFQPLWKILVSWDDNSQYMENKKCSKPPTRYRFVPMFHFPFWMLRWEKNDITDITTG